MIKLIWHFSIKYGVNLDKGYITWDLSDIPPCKNVAQGGFMEGEATHES